PCSTTRPCASTACRSTKHSSLPANVCRGTISGRAGAQVLEGSMSHYTNRDVIEAWSAAWAEPGRADAWGEEGDFGRRHLLNPTLLRMLGDTQGHRVLAAGCGQGYLCRLLARLGAAVTGVEPAASFYRYAVERESKERLGISYVQADLCDLSGYDGLF